eukprot:3095961-Pyramimonas_sp.AAC.1
MSAKGLRQGRREFWGPAGRHAEPVGGLGRQPQQQQRRTPRAVQATPAALALSLACPSTGGRFKNRKHSQGRCFG